MNDNHRAEVVCPCGRRHTIDTSPETNDARGALVALSDGWGVIKPGTLTSWARSGRLRSFRGARSQLLAWEADIRAAVEHEPVERQHADRHVDDDGDPQLAALHHALGGGR